jgi:hypothetical protein
MPLFELNKNPSDLPPQIFDVANALIDHLRARRVAETEAQKRARAVLGECGYKWPGRTEAPERTAVVPVAFPQTLGSSSRKPTPRAPP